MIQIEAVYENTHSVHKNKKDKLKIPGPQGTRGPRDVSRGENINILPSCSRHVNAKDCRRAVSRGTAVELVQLLYVWDFMVSIENMQIDRGIMILLSSPSPHAR